MELGFKGRFSDFKAFVLILQKLIIKMILIFHIIFIFPALQIFNLRIRLSKYNYLYIIIIVMFSLVPSTLWESSCSDDQDFRELLCTYYQQIHTGFNSNWNLWNHHIQVVQKISLCSSLCLSRHILTLSVMIHNTCLPLNYAASTCSTSNLVYFPFFPRLTYAHSLCP